MNQTCRLRKGMVIIMCKEKVSVIIPTYNRASTIKRAIDSVLGQTYQDFELIVVDDGSTDDTQQIVDSYKDSRVRYLKTEERRGANHARNVGIQNAKGEYIAFQDSDDLWFKDKLEKQMDVFRMQDDVDIVFSRFMRRYLDGSTELIPNKNFTQEMLGKDIAHILSRENVIGTPTMIVRKQCFVQYGLFDIEAPRFQDWEINLRFAQGARFFCVDEPLVEINESEKSITNTKGSEFSGLAFLIKKHADFFKRQGVLEYHLGILLLRAVKRNKVSELEDWIGKDLLYESIYVYAQKNRNIRFNYTFMRKWLMDDECNRTINDFFKQYQAGSIVIYGFGDIGKLLIKNLTNENASKIKFLIDQNISQSADCEIKRLKDVSKSDFTGVKCIVITAIAHESEIRANLQGLVPQDIFVGSIQDIVNEY